MAGRSLSFQLVASFPRRMPKTRLGLLRRCWESRATASTWTCLESASSSSGELAELGRIAGVAVFCRLLAGYAPFEPPSRFTQPEFDERRESSLSQGLCRFRPQQAHSGRYWCHVSGPCRELVAQLLSLQPAKRGTVPCPRQTRCNSFDVSSCCTFQDHT